MINDLRQKSPRRFSPRKPTLSQQTLRRTHLRQRAHCYFCEALDSFMASHHHFSIALETEMKRRQFLKLSLAGSGGAMLSSPADIVWKWTPAS